MSGRAPLSREVHIPDEKVLDSGVFNVPKDEVELAKEQHHKAAPGPAMPKDPSSIENAKSRDQLHAEAASLNADRGEVRHHAAHPGPAISQEKLENPRSRNELRTEAAALNVERREAERARKDD